MKLLPAIIAATAAKVIQKASSDLRSLTPVFLLQFLPQAFVPYSQAQSFGLALSLTIFACYHPRLSRKRLFRDKTDQLGVKRVDSFDENIFLC